MRAMVFLLPRGFGAAVFSTKSDNLSAMPIYLGMQVRAPHPNKGV